MSTALQQAKDRLQSQQTRVPVQVSRDAIQYCWFAPVNVTHRDQGLINRLRWTPITRQEKWVSIAEKQNPDEFVAVRNLKAEKLRQRPMPPPNQGLLWVKPGAIANSLHLEFGEWGLLISPTLAKIGSQHDIDVFASLRLDDIYFPMAEDDLPTTFTDIKARIEAVLRAIEQGKLESLVSAATARHFKALPSESARMVTAVGKEMLESVARSRAYQEMQLNITHAGFEKAKTESGHRGTYDQRDRQMMAFLEVVPQDEVQNRNAQANMTLIEIAKQQLQNGSAAQGIDYAELGKGIAAGLLAAGVIAKPEPETAAPPSPGKK